MHQRGVGRDGIPPEFNGRILFDLGRRGEDWLSPSAENPAVLQRAAPALAHSEYIYSSSCCVNTIRDVEYTPA